MSDKLQEIQYKIDDAKEHMYSEVELVTEAMVQAIKDSINDNYDNKQEYYGGADWEVSDYTAKMHNEMGYGSIMERSGDLKSVASDALLVRRERGANFTYHRAIGINYEVLPVKRDLNYGEYHDTGNFKFLPTEDELEMGYTDDFDILGGGMDPVQELEDIADALENEIADAMDELDLL